VFGGRVLTRTLKIPQNIPDTYLRTPWCRINIPGKEGKIHEKFYSIFER
jgi:hypothetical protein